MTADSPGRAQRRDLLFRLPALEAVEVFAVAFHFHLLLRHEAQGGGIEAVAHACRRWTIVENVAKVRIVLPTAWGFIRLLNI